MRYRICTTQEFDKDFQKLDKSLRIQIEKEISQLELNPYIGKPLNYNFFREKKVRNYRFYYLIYEEYIVVFIIALSDKKSQQVVINKIRGLIDIYKEIIQKKFNG